MKLPPAVAAEGWAYLTHNRHCWISGCIKEVPEDADHIGLCDSHHEQLRWETNLP